MKVDDVIKKITPVVMCEKCTLLQDIIVTLVSSS